MALEELERFSSLSDWLTAFQHQDDRDLSDVRGYEVFCDVHGHE